MSKGDDKGGGNGDDEQYELEEFASNNRQRQRRGVVPSTVGRWTPTEADCYNIPSVDIVGQIKEMDVCNVAHSKT